MRRKNLQGLFFLGFLLALLVATPGYSQFGKRARRAALRTRNKQISRFTVRTDFSKSKKYISFGGGMGATNYFGDLAPSSRRGSSYMGYTRTFMTGYYLHRIHPHITIRGSLSWMQLRGDDYAVSKKTRPNGDDKGRFIRNLSFRNNIYEIAATGIFELFPTDRGYLRRNFINPYGILGLCLFYHNPVAKTPIKAGETSRWVDLRPLGTEGQYTGIAGTPRPYSLVQLGVPLGLGIRYRVADKWDLSLEFCYRFVFTDYIDDVSGRYPSDTVYAEMVRQGNELGVTMSNRSSEFFASIGGEDRRTIFRQWRDNSLSKIERIDFTGDSDYSMTRVNGNENGAAPRGNKRRDYWMVTAVNLAYILEIKQKPPKFR